MSGTGLRIEIGGVVQGVGFRPAVYRFAREHRLAGRVSNGARGVTIEAFGEEGAIEAFLATLVGGAPPAARIGSITVEAIPLEDVAEFVIVPSTAGDERRVSIPADLPTCAACLRELFDPADRRFHYPFINCTDCGPRFTIARDVPYDRPATTMALFPLCDACRAEYENPLSRRFHAQPNACPVCGPRLALIDAHGGAVAGDPVGEAARALAEGHVVAVKGIGGFHLACDATSAAAVSRLRARKRREEKPFAVMVRDLAAARALAEPSPQEEELLASPARPIVLVPKRAGAALAEEVAPGNPHVGLLLAYAPVHHLLLEAAGRPLVMTSANLSEEPIVHEDADALARLGGIADLLLVNDRPIATPCDDSVVRVVGGGSLLLRRSRGYVPEPLVLAAPVARPLLAVGGHLKNTFCLASGERATLGAHVGDLENLRTYRLFRESIERMQRFLGVVPRVVAHDLHPAYLSTHYALGNEGVRTIGVQHHHAHVAAVMAEHRLEGKVLGLSWDGSGWGPDGTSWGGELLLASLEGFERLATLRPLALAGGEAAIRQPWRLALAMLRDALGEDAPDAPLTRFPLFRSVAPEALGVVARMLERNVNAPLAHGAGRWFDAVGALVLGKGESRYEGQIALEWNLVADPRETGVYPFAIEVRGGIDLLDLRPMVRAVVEDLARGAGAPAISARFHETLVAGAEALVRRAVERHGPLPVVLSGGCFANARLAEGLLAALGGLDVHLPRRVPAGDGGLCLGQTVVADAIVKTER